MASRDISDLDPTLQPKAQQFLDLCNQKFSTRLIQTWRDPIYQDKLKASGVSVLSGGESLHCCTIDGQPASKAFDFAIFDSNDGYVKDGTDPRYTAAGQIAKSLGLVWGGDFIHPHPDPDHVQLAAEK